MEQIVRETLALNIDNYAKELNSLLASQNDKQAKLCVSV